MNADTSTIAELESSAAVYENLASCAVDGMKNLLDDAGANLERINAIAAMADEIRERFQAIQGTCAPASLQARPPVIGLPEPTARESFALAWDFFVRGCKALAIRK